MIDNRYINNQYLVIKLSGNWLNREHTRQRLKLFIDDMEMLGESKVIPLRADKSICFADYKAYPESAEYAKKEIAHNIANYLLSKGLIQFETTKEQYAIKVRGQITIISDKKGGEE